MKYLRFIPAISFGTLIFYLSAQPNLRWVSESERGIFGFSVDSAFLHLVIYAFFGMLIFFCFRNCNNNNFLLTVVLGSVYGVTDEIHQSFVPFRCCTIPDMIVNVFGVVVGAS